ncbi:MAG TPA: hypothetical protein VMN99_01645 [Anaerolineales bacterium]|nr:hypothetical protein [Anaerolineales bacterium]
MQTKQKLNNQRDILPTEQEKVRACPAGVWSALITTLGGIVYFLIILAMVLTGRFTMPPSDDIQLFGGIISLLFCPVIVIVMVSLHTVTAPGKKVFSQSSQAFTLLFATAVSINRFTQLGVVSRSIASGTVEGLDWFLPYGDRSVMFGLEMMGWGWFLGLAMLIAAPIFSGRGIQFWLRWLMISYGILGLISAVAYLIGSPLAVIGFVAWGVILFIITGLLTVHFK